MTQPSLLNMEFAVSPDGSYVMARATGQLTPESAITDIRTLVEFINMTGLTKMLLDWREQQDLFGTLPSIDFANTLAQLMSPRYKFAVLVKVDLKEARFLETVIVNRRVNALFFNDHDEALAWLGVAS